jgi:hypothetical protein
LAGHQRSLNGYFFLLRPADFAGFCDFPLGFALPAFLG